MAAPNRTLNILLVVLTILIVVASIVVGKLPEPRTSVHDHPPIYHQDVVMLGVRASKFEGMALHMDSPNVLLNKAHKLNLTDAQQTALSAIVDRSRAESLALLTDEQRASLGPIPSEPFVFDSLDRTVINCSTAGQTCSTASETASACAPSCAHDH